MAEKASADPDTWCESGGTALVQGLGRLCGAAAGDQLLHLPDIVLSDRCVPGRGEQGVFFFEVCYLCEHVPETDLRTDHKIWRYLGQPDGAHFHGAGVGRRYEAVYSGTGGQGATGRPGGNLVARGAGDRI